jgi:hypothetical protein
MNKLLLLIITNIFLFSGYGLQVGAYKNKENIPTDIDFGVNYKILEQGDYYKLTLGPFNTRQQVKFFQNRYGIDGFIVGMSNTKQKDLRGERENNLFNMENQNNNGIRYNADKVDNQNTRTDYKYNNQIQKTYVVEILSANDRNNVPTRIIKKVASLGLSPKFILEKGLYRLIVGPYQSLSLAQNIGARIESVFGRSVYVVKFDKNKVDFAQNAMEFVPMENGLDILSNDNNEHIGYLEQQRRRVKNKYNNNPFENNDGRFQERDPRIKKQSGLRPYIRKTEQQISKELRDKFKNINKSNKHILGMDSGSFFGISIASSKNELIINGKKIGGSFLYGAYGGYKINRNTLIGIDYFAKENKKSNIFIKDDYTAEVDSSYEYMLSSYIKYRFFLPTNKSLFISSKFGLGITKQLVKTYIPVNGGRTDSYLSLYTEGVLGLGVGFFFSKISSLELMYNTHINTKTITSSVRINLNVEF